MRKILYIYRLEYKVSTMSSIYPNAYDMLNISGILPYDVNQIVTGEKSEYLKEHGRAFSLDIPKDKFEKKETHPKHGEHSEHGEKKEPKEIEWSKVGVAALGTYILGALLSHSTNPIKGAGAILKNAGKILSLPFKLIAKH